MPTELTFAQIDAFADRPFAGNPAAVMPLDAFLDDATLQAIAEENNLSETAFIVRIVDGDADYELRWFTPTTEVVLCGHATLASGHFVLSADAERDRVRFRTRNAGTLEVRRAGDGYELDLPAWAPSPQPVDGLDDALGARSEATLYHPHRYAVAVLADAAAVRALRPDFKALAAMGDVLAIATAPGDDGFDVVSRVFAAGAGIDEDPVTGSAHAVITPYWADRLGRGRFRAFQASRRGGAVDCRLAGDRVVLGGRCVTVIEGRFRL